MQKTRIQQHSPVQTVHLRADPQSRYCIPKDRQERRAGRRAVAAHRRLAQALCLRPKPDGAVFSLDKRLGEPHAPAWR